MKTIYQKYCDGDHLSDDELAIGSADFERAANSLSKLGPKFSITRKECSRVANELRSFINARARQRAA